MELNYRGKTYATYDGARRKYETWLTVAKDSCFFVGCVSTGKYFAACAISGHETHLVRPLAEAGIVVLRP